MYQSNEMAKCKTKNCTNEINHTSRKMEYPSMVYKYEHCNTCWGKEEVRRYEKRRKDELHRLSDYRGVGDTLI